MEGLKNLPIKEAVNKVTWSRDGRQVMVGDSRGVLYVVNIDDKFSIPKQGAEGRFKDLIGALSKRQSPEEESAGGAQAAQGARGRVDEEFIASIIAQKQADAPAS